MPISSLHFFDVSVVGKAIVISTGENPLSVLPSFLIQLSIYIFKIATLKFQLYIILKQL